MNVKKENDLQKYILMLITKPEDERLVEKAFSGLGLPIVFKLRGHGTAESELLDICGLDGTLRHINLCLINRAAISNVLCRLGEQLKLRKRGHGIAAVLRITGLQETIRQIVEEEERGLMPKDSDIPGDGGDRSMGGRKEEPYGFGSGDRKATDTGKGGAHMASERMYSMIFVAAEQGYSEDIIAAARTAGARGGTVIRGRRSGSESAMTLLGVATQEEQEFTMIIVDRDKRAAVMQAISSACGLKTEAHGMVISLPVEAALGLE